MKIKGWKRYQHFKDRKPPWIKLYRDLLDDVEWFELSGDDAKSLVQLWLIASEDEDKEGNLPSIKKMAFRFRVSEEEMQSTISKLSSWLIHDDITMISSRYQDGLPETETETDSPSKEKNIYGVVTLCCTDGKDQVVQFSDNGNGTWTNTITGEISSCPF